MEKLEKLRVKIFADTANFEELKEACKLKFVKGVTTNPSLMKKAKIIDYEKFARELINLCDDKSVSFEVFSDEFDEMEKQALTIASWGENVYVKIPVINTKKESATQLIGYLNKQGVQVNVTAIFTVEQIEKVLQELNSNTKAVISIFAGRIADSGRDPQPTIIEALKKVKNYPNVEILWASTRESFNIIQADKIGCDIITVPYGLIKKANSFGKDLNEYTLETVEMFYKDALSAGYSIKEKINV